MEYLNNLRSLRDALGLLQADVAKKLNVGQAEYSRIEAGKRRIGAHLSGLAKILNVESSEITETEKEPAPTYGVQEPRQLPVYGFPLPDESGLVDLSKSMMSKIDCPPPLNNIAGARGVFCFGNEMEPMLLNGDIALIDPTIPPQTGRLVLVIQNIGGIEAGMLRIFVKGRAGQCIVEALNPNETVEITDGFVRCDSVIAVRYNIE